MSGSYYLKKRLQSPASMSVTIDGSGPVGGWEDAYLINGAHRECHPDFIAKPIGPDPHGFLVCQRKKNERGIPLDIASSISHAYDHIRSDPRSRNGSDGQLPPLQYEDVCNPAEGDRRMYTQSYDLYNNKREAIPRVTNQPYALPDRRLPNQAHLQGQDYYRDGIKYRNIGMERVNTYLPGDFGYEENKYYFSSPPPKYDITHLVQPYGIWKREQIRMGNFTQQEMAEFDRQHSYTHRHAVA